MESVGLEDSAGGGSRSSTVACSPLSASVAGRITEDMKIPHGTC